MKISDYRLAAPLLLLAALFATPALADFFAPKLSEPGGEAAKAARARLAVGRCLVCTATRGQNGRTASSWATRYGAPAGGRGK